MRAVNPFQTKLNTVGPYQGTSLKLHLQEAMLKSVTLHC